MFNTLAIFCEAFGAGGKNQCATWLVCEFGRRSSPRSTRVLSNPVQAALYLGRGGGGEGQEAHEIFRKAWENYLNSRQYIGAACSNLGPCPSLCKTTKVEQLSHLWRMWQSVRLKTPAKASGATCQWLFIRPRPFRSSTRGSAVQN